MIETSTIKPASLCASKTSWLNDLLLLTIFISLLFSLFLGSRPLMAPDEGRYSEIPREMVVTGDYLTPHLNGLKYFEKPPLFYWLEALPIKYLGINEWSLRSLPVFLGLLGCLLVYSATRKLYNRRSALYSSVILASSGLYYLMAHTITPDIALTLTLSASLLCFLLGATEPRRVQRRQWLIAMYGCAALAVLTKGLIAMVLPAMIIGLWICLYQKWRDLPSYFPLTGLFLFAAIALPWHLLVQLKNPEFAHFYFIEQHFLRYLTNYADRGQPFWFISATTLLGFCPWTPLLLTAPWVAKQNQPFITWLKTLWQQRHNHPATGFLLLWVFSIGLFFSCSHSQLIPYALPIIPALAILLGRYLDQYAATNPAILRRYFIFMLTIALIGGGAAILLVTEQHAIYWPLAFAVLIIALICSLLFPKKSLYFFIAGLLLSYSFLNAGYVDKRSIKALALEIKAQAKHNETVATYETYFQDLPVYLQRPVQVVDYQGELAFGIQHQPQQDWMVKRAIFWRNWQHKPRIFMIMNISDYKLTQYYHPTGDLPLYPINITRNLILVTNHPL